MSKHWFAKTPFCACGCGATRDELRLRVEVRDLRARLREVRRSIGHIIKANNWRDVDRATDLRVKNWRKP